MSTRARDPDAGPREDGLDRALAEHATWLTVERGLRPNTLEAYRRDLRAYVAFLRSRGVSEPSEVDSAAVRDYLAVRSAADDDGRAPAPATVARSLVALRSLHQFLVDEGMVAHDPTEEVQAPRVPAGIPKALAEDEVLTLLGSVEGREPRALRDRAMLEVLYASGMRISELVGLDRADVDLEGNLVRVLGKGAKERIVPIGRPARAAVEDYLRSARPVLERPGAGARGAGDALFLNARGGRLTRQGCWSVVRSAGARAGLGERVHPHVLRHSCATHLLDHGADIRMVQEVLGHASVSTTQVYTLVSAARLRAVYESAHPRARS
ncbi:MAG TPA: site-specific tyrosine recombinase XerD [Acidimicrobiia bacterium]|nr:site-specific tyrosine recombinase XerD [Acidimicrobiia bacterium]